MKTGGGSRSGVLFNSPAKSCLRSGAKKGVAVWGGDAFKDLLGNKEEIGFSDD